MFGFDSDQDLVKKALAGSSMAWEKLVRRHEKRIYNCALRMTRNPDDALDLMQEVFLTVFKCLDQFNNEGNFVNWLLKITSHRAIDQFRKHNPAKPIDDPEPHLHVITDPGPDPHQDLHLSDTNRQIIETLKLLSHDQQLVIELKFFQQLTFDEIAASLQISPNTAKSRLYAALRKLKPHLEVKHAM